MIRLFYLAAAVLILAGGVFALQGLSFLPSRVMYGRQEWVVIGSAMVVAGGGLVWLVRRRARESPRQS